MATYKDPWVGGGMLVHGSTTLSAGTATISTGMSKIKSAGCWWASDVSTDPSATVSHNAGVSPQMRISVSGDEVTFTTLEVAPRLCAADIYFMILGH